MMMNFLSSVRLFGQAVSIILLLSTFASAADDDDRSASRGTPSKGGTWAEYYAANIKDALASNINSKPVSRPKPTPADDVSQNSVQNRPSSTSVSLPGGSYALQMKTFAIPLLSTNFPYKMKYRRSKDITKFVSTFLEEQWARINSNDDNDSTPTFQLNCNKSKSKMGNDKRWVITCEDNMVIFKNSPKLVDSFISDVLTNKDTMEKFLERMYPKYYKGKQQMMNNKGRSEEDQQRDQNNAYIRTYYSLEEEEKKMIVVVEEDSLPLSSSISQEAQDGNDEDDRAYNEESYPTQEGRRQRRRNDTEEQEEKEDERAAKGDKEDGDDGSTRMLRGGS
jgi:hypothetical protein